MPLSASWSFPWVAHLRWLAVAAVCFNHISASLLKLPQPFVSPFLSRGPADFGIAVLFVASGFVIQSSYRHRLRFGSGWLGAAARFWIKRLLARWPAVALIVVVDLCVSSFPLAAQRHAVAHSLPSFLTLTQNWSYGLQGNGTTVFPFASANIAWLGSTLWFLHLVYPFVGPSLARVRLWWIGAAVLAAVVIGHLVVQIWLAVSLPELTRYATDHFGAKAAENPSSVYSFYKWISFYCPYVRLFEFMAGLGAAVFYGRYLAHVTRKRQRTVVWLTLIAGLGCWGVAEQWNTPKGVEVGAHIYHYDLIAVALVWLAAIGTECPRLEGVASSSLLRWSSSAYLLWMWHLVWFNAYALPVWAGPTTPRDWMFIWGRLVLLCGFAIVTSVGIDRLLSAVRLCVRDKLSLG